MLLAKLEICSCVIARPVPWFWRFHADPSVREISGGVEEQARRWVEPSEGRTGLAEVGGDGCQQRDRGVSLKTVPP